MRETGTRTVDLSAVEAARVREALESHEAKADVDGEAVDALEAEFDVEVEADETVTFELTRAEARIVVAALEERELRASGIVAERLLSLRERFAETFGFEVRETGTEPPAEPYPSPIPEN